MALKLMQTRPNRSIVAPICWLLLNTDDEDFIGLTFISRLFPVSIAVCLNQTLGLTSAKTMLACSLWLVCSFGCWKQRVLIVTELSMFTGRGTELKWDANNPGGKFLSSQKCLLPRVSLQKDIYYHWTRVSASSRGQETDPGWVCQQQRSCSQA